MKLALAQELPTDGRIEEAFARIACRARAAACAGASMLVLPELIVPGYNRPDLHGCGDGGWRDRMGEIARGAQIGLTFGWAEAAEGRIWNAASTLGPDGALLGHYRKIQLFGQMEAASFTPGTAAPPVFDYLGRRIGLLICYDIEFPHHAADLARRGADTILVPTANPAGFEHVQRLLVPARAYESRLTIAYANYCGTEAGLAFGGGSVIVGPDGQPLAQAGRAEALLITDLPEIESYAPGLLSTQAQDLKQP